MGPGGPFFVSSVRSANAAPKLQTAVRRTAGSRFRMEFQYEFAGKILVAILLILVVHDQLTSPAADPRDSAPLSLPPIGGQARSVVDPRGAALEEASLLLKLAERAIPYATAPLVQVSMHCIPTHRLHTDTRTQACVLHTLPAAIRRT